MSKQFFSRKATISKLTHLQSWRTGKIEEWSKRNRIPPPKSVTKILDSALYYLQNNEEDVWTP